MNSNGSVDLMEQCERLFGHIYDRKWAPPRAISVAPAAKVRNGRPQLARRQRFPTLCARSGELHLYHFDRRRRCERAWRLDTRQQIDEAFEADLDELLFLIEYEQEVDDEFLVESDEEFVDEFDEDPEFDHRYDDSWYEELYSM